MPVPVGPFIPKHQMFHLHTSLPQGFHSKYIIRSVIACIRHLQWHWDLGQILKLLWWLSLEQIPIAIGRQMFLSL